MSGVQVLDEGDLVAGRGALTGDDGGVSKEELPDLLILAQPPHSKTQTYSVPSVAILCQYLVLVCKPVSVPSPESSRVVNTNGINMLDLETGALNRSDIVVERGRSIGTREDIFIHE